jgi:hypothetical protein
MIEGTWYAGNAYQSNAVGSATELWQRAPQINWYIQAGVTSVVYYRRIIDAYNLVTDCEWCKHHSLADLNHTHRQAHKAPRLPIRGPTSFWNRKQSPIIPREPWHADITDSQAHSRRPQVMRGRASGIRTLLMEVFSYASLAWVWILLLETPNPAIQRRHWWNFLKCVPYQQRTFPLIRRARVQAKLENSLSLSGDARYGVRWSRVGKASLTPKVLDWPPYLTLPYVCMYRCIGRGSKNTTQI